MADRMALACRSLDIADMSKAIPIAFFGQLPPWGLAAIRTRLGGFAHRLIDNQLPIKKDDAAMGPNARRATKHRPRDSLIVGEAKQFLEASSTIVKHFESETGICFAEIAVRLLFKRPLNGGQQQSRGFRRERTTAFFCALQ
jgi:hypothetical protein